MIRLTIRCGYLATPRVEVQPGAGPVSQLDPFVRADGIGVYWPGFDRATSGEELRRALYESRECGMIP